MQSKRDNSSRGRRNSRRLFFALALLVATGLLFATQIGEGGEAIQNAIGPQTKNETIKPTVEKESKTEPRVKLSDAEVAEHIERFFVSDIVVDAREMLKNAALVEVFRIEPEIDLTAENRLGGYRVISGPTKIDAKLGAEIAAALTDTTTYDFQRGPAFCGFAPGIAIRFSQKKESSYDRVCVMLCFKCEDAGIFFPLESEGHLMTMAPGRKRLVGLMKKTFPKDAAVLALTDEPKEEDLDESKEDPNATTPKN